MYEAYDDIPLTAPPWRNIRRSMTGKTGLLCPVGNVEHAAREIKQLLGNKKKWEAMSSAAAASAKEKFDSEVIVPRSEALYERILGGT